MWRLDALINMDFVANLAPQMLYELSSGFQDARPNDSVHSEE